MKEDIANELDTVKQLVTRVLSENKATRNNETLLYLECCRKLGAKSIDDIEKMNLSIITVHKMRQVIQNKDGLFKSDVEVRKQRANRATKIKDYMCKL